MECTGRMNPETNAMTYQNSAQAPFGRASQSQFEAYLLGNAISPITKALDLALELKKQNNKK